MEQRGVEPLASYMRNKRSTNWATVPFTLLLLFFLLNPTAYYLRVPNKYKYITCSFPSEPLSCQRTARRCWAWARRDSTSLRVTSKHCLWSCWIGRQILEVRDVLVERRNWWWDLDFLWFLNRKPIALNGLSGSLRNRLEIVEIEEDYLIFRSQQLSSFLNNLSCFLRRYFPFRLLIYYSLGGFDVFSYHDARRF